MGEERLTGIVMMTLTEISMTYYFVLFCANKLMMMMMMMRYSVFIWMSMTLLITSPPRSEKNPFAL